MTITDHIPGLRGNGKRRAVDEVERLREDNTRLLNRQLAADDFFAILTHDRDETEKAWRQEKERRETAEKELKQAENAIRLRDRRIADLERRVDVGVKAEHVIAKTQELDMEEIRRHCVMPLHQAAATGRLGPVTDPGQVTTH